MVRLYKIVDGKMKLVDSGVEAQAESYIKQGYIVVPDTINKATFKALDVAGQIKNALKAE